jgi:glycerol-3-phosphate dehydrogenase (NAD(P)+)
VGPFIIEFGEDLRSVAVSGVLKNIYALGLGIADGLDLGFNFKGILTNKSLEEMRMLFRQLGIGSDGLDSPAGIPDFFATGWSGESFNYRIGKALAEGILDDEHAKGEGVNAVREIGAKVRLNKTPVLNIIRNVVIDGGNPQDLEKAVI